MPRILIVALPQDEALAEITRERIAHYYPDTRIIPQDSSAAAIASAHALIVLINQNWAGQIQAHPACYEAIKAALRRSDLLIITATIDEAPLPTLADLPEEIRALAYMSTLGLRSAQATLPDDLRRLASQIHMHFKEMEAQAAKSLPVAARGGRRGLPCNLLILLGALAFAGLLILIPALRGDPPPAAFSTVVAPNDPAVIGQSAPDPVIMVGVAVGVGTGNDRRGQEMLNGVKLALAQRPTVSINGRRFRVDLLTQDTACSAIGGLEAARLFVTDPDIAGVLGDVCNLSCAAAAPVYAAAGMPTISPGCTAAGLTLDGENSFNRSLPSEAYAGTAAAQFVYETLGLRRAALLHDELRLGGHLAAAFADEFTRLGGEVALRLSIETFTASISSVVEQTEATAPELIYYAGRGRNAALIRAGLPATPMMLGDYNSAAEFIEEAQTSEPPAPTDGVYSLTLLPPRGPALDALAERYADMHTLEPQTALFAHAYDAALMLIEGIEATTTLQDQQPNPDRAALNSFIRAYNGEGITGILNCGGTGDCAIAAWQPWVMRDDVLIEFEAE